MMVFSKTYSSTDDFHLANYFSLQAIKYSRCMHKKRILKNSLSAMFNLTCLDISKHLLQIMSRRR